MELVSPCAVGALDGAVEFGGSRRQDVEREVFVGAGLLELGHELGAAVDLDGFDGVGHLEENLVEKAGGVPGGGLFAGSGDGPFGEGIVGVEVLDGHAGQRMDRKRVDLDDVAGLFEYEVLGLADGVRAFCRQYGRAGQKPARALLVIRASTTRTSEGSSFRAIGFV